MFLEIQEVQILKVHTWTNWDVSVPFSIFDAGHCHWSFVGTWNFFENFENFENFGNFLKNIMLWCDKQIETLSKLLQRTDCNDVWCNVWAQY